MNRSSLWVILEEYEFEQVEPSTSAPMETFTTPPQENEDIEVTFEPRSNVEVTPTHFTQTVFIHEREDDEEEDEVFPL